MTHRNPEQDVLDDIAALITDQLRAGELSPTEAADLYCMCGQPWHGLPEFDCLGTPTAGEWRCSRTQCGLCSVRSLAAGGPARIWMAQAYHQMISRMEEIDPTPPSDTEPVRIVMDEHAKYLDDAWRAGAGEWASATNPLESQRRQRRVNAQQHH